EIFMGRITVTQLREKLWQLHEEDIISPVDAYLVCGEERCVMIDSLQDTEALYEEVRKLTQLPVDLVLTHGHLDHVGRATEQFKKAGCGVYLRHEDESILGSMGSLAFPAGYFQDIEPGRVFPLGGRTLEVILMPGHTAGSLALLDRENEILFSGDSIGSGPFWLQLPHSLSMETFLRSVSALLDEVDGMKNLLVLPGHRFQSPNPLGLPYIQDVFETAQMLFDGTLEGQAGTMVFEGVDMTFKMVEHKSMLGFYYAPDRMTDPA
ncbi:MAG: MBL fold metallo-hydrolase, partial [Hominenteromicrobium sp.]